MLSLHALRHYAMLTTLIFDNMFRLHYRRLLLFALQYIGEEQDCRDIVSMAFEQLWKMRTDIAEATVRQWLYTSVRNGCIDHIRHRRHKLQYVEYCKKLADVVSDTDKLAESDEREKLVSMALDRLDGQTRSVVELCYLHQMKYKDVAEKLGITQNTVRKRMIKALKLIRNINVDNDS